MDYNIIVSLQVDQQLGYLIKNGQQYIAEEVAYFLREIKSTGPHNKSNTKDIGDGVYRKRVQRWRLLYTVESDTIKFWILDIEKDTKKDYKKRKSHILKQMKKK